MIFSLLLVLLCGRGRLLRDGGGAGGGRLLGGGGLLLLLLVLLLFLLLFLLLLLILVLVLLGLVLLLLSAGRGLECTSKGIRRQGVVLKHGNSLQKEPVPFRHMPLPM